MILAGKYEILEQGGGVAVNVDRARHLGSGKLVYLHRLPGGSPAAADTMRLALQYAVGNRNNSIFEDAFEENNCTYLVTDQKPEYLSLVDFLRRAVSGGNGRPRQPQSRRIQPRETRIADQDGLKSFLSALPQSKPSLPVSEEGEFTRLFNANTASPAEMPEPDFKVSPSGGEFTQMFSTPLRPSDPMQEIGPPPFPPSKPESSVGEFTRFFGPESRPVSALPKARAGLLGENPLPAPALNPDASEPGEFTRIIRRAPLSDISSESLQIQAEQLKSMSQPAAIPIPSAIPVPAAIPKPQIAAPPALKTPPAAQPRLHSKGVSPVLILIFAIVVAAAAVVAFFLVRK